MNDLLLLANLLAGPQHGYALKKQVSLFSGKREMHNNLVYPLLRRFVANKWVTKKTVPGERGQNRQQYAITSLGRQSLMDRLRSFSEQDARSEDAFRVRVGFFSMLSGEDREKILGTREVALRSRNQILSNLTKAMALDAYGSEVVAFLREQSETELAWVGRLRQLDSKTQKSKAD